MAETYTDAELSAFLDEDLPQDRMAGIEQALRNDSALGERLTAIVGQRDAGLHALGAIWRRERLSCPSREQLGSFLLEVLEDSHADYIRFHLNTIGCRVCNASLDDLRNQHATEEDAAATQSRRRKYFQSSAGYLSSDG
ncbi:hypothetical protein [Bythopirellula polymerisocia]|uniref:Uncharacterized protein n=1 Tax=Bythopirellula polymerisocia TaxID=2528003 RepID=A0A5C6CZI4_9BACT|nr:hypothetical protein [Bythopirellula polymerisocia]TWU28079.1 hypothetical protein Pla144_13660 [Bythopirellula polymerisocia]